MIGQLVQNYRIEKLIAEGGMGNVYLGMHTQIEKKAAIKVLNPLLAGNADLKKRFKEEALTMSKFDHPNIVSILDYVEQDSSTYLIMEYVEGDTLDHYIKKNNLDEKAYIDLFLQMLEAVDFIHQHNIVHRDIKPSNFIINPKNKVKLIDFGIAKRLESDQKLTRTGMNIGTPYYMSPEQVRGETVDCRSDIYSMGVTLYQMFSGKCPYEDIVSEYSIYNKIVNEPLPDLTSFKIKVSDKIKNIISKATEKNTTNRFQTCDEFKVALLKNEDFTKTLVDDFSRTDSKPMNDFGKTVITIPTEPPAKPIEKAEPKVILNEPPKVVPPPFFIPKKKNNAPIVLGVIGGIIVFSLVIYLIFGGSGKTKEFISKGDDYFKVALYDSALMQYNKAYDIDNDDSACIKKYFGTDYFIKGLKSFYEAKYSNALDLFIKSANLENQGAYYYLGELTFNGLGTKRDYKKASEYTNKAAEKGFEMAYWRVGWIYERAVDVKKDTAKANDYLGKSFDAIKKMAENGDPEAQGNYAGFFSKGFKVKKSNIIALEWHKKAAEQGYAFEQANTGHYYFYENDSIKIDYEEAFRWYDKAATAGDPNGQSALANLYLTGKGVNKNVSKAISWLQKAADQNHSDAYNSLGNIYMSSEYGVEDQIAALKYYKKALDADDRNLNAMNNIAYSYYSGKGESINYTESIKYFQMMIKTDSSLAMPYYNISFIYEEGGNGITKDMKKSFDYCKKGAELGNASAQNSLGMKYYNGEGCTKDETQAKLWLKKSAAQGNATAASNLASISNPVKKKNYNNNNNNYKKKDNDTKKGVKDRLKNISN